MSILDSRADEMLGAVTQVPRIAQPKPEPKFSAWDMTTAIPRGAVEGMAQVGASGADLLKAIRYTTQNSGKGMDATGAPIEAFSSATGDALREYGTMLRPDPLTAHAAEQVIYQASRVLTKVVGGAAVGGVPGVLAAAGEEGITQSDELRLQGVDAKTRMEAGYTAAAGTALAALPMAGTTLAGTAALYAVGGPGGFMAQQAATREILQSAGYDKIAMQYDPFDPVGLAVSVLVPLPFAAYGMRSARVAQAKAVADAEAATNARVAAAPEPPKTATAQAVADAWKAEPEVVDAARVRYAVEEQQRASLADPADPVAVRADETAASRAAEQMATGERVSVADVAPAPRVNVTDTPEFKAFFGESKVTTPEGLPLMMYHGTAADVPAIDPASLQTEGIHLTASPDQASTFAISRAMDGGRGANVMPVYVRAENIKAVEMISPDSIRQAQAEGFDAVRRGDHLVVFSPEQIKSAIGNTGAFHPNSGSLTDSPYASWTERVNAAIKDMRREVDAARPKAQTADDGQQTQAATNPSAGVAEGGPGPREAQGTGEAASPGEKVDAASAQARIDAVAAQFPDLQVQLDGMDAPMKLSDFMAMTKAEADEMLADAPLMQVAAECAILNGT